MLVIGTHATSASAAARFYAAKFDSPSCFISHTAACFIPRSRYRKFAGRVKSGSGIRATAKEQPDSGPVRQNSKPQRYHPSEEILESDFLENGIATLRSAETARTIIEVNSKATVMFSGLVDEEIHENIFWPDLHYVKDEYGNIYFQVKNDEDILQTLTAEENVVQVIIGLDTKEVISEMEALGHTEIDFGIDELDDEDGDFDDEEDEEDEDDDDEDEDEDEDNYDKGWISILDEDQDEESDGSLGDWAKLETMRSSHPMYFAKKLAEVVSDDPIDCMDQPSAGLAIQGLLRPAFVEHSVIEKHISGPESSGMDTDHITEKQLRECTVEINGHRHELESEQDNQDWAEEFENDEKLGNGFAFYKLDMIKIQLISADGHQSYVEIEDFRRAQPDGIAHSAAEIIARLKAMGEKTTLALKSLCWRCNGIQVEECALVGVDSLGFDVRVCSGTQVQTLRFAFKKRASSEYSAESQLNDLLFPRAQKLQQKKEAQQTES